MRLPTKNTRKAEHGRLLPNFHFWYSDMLIDILSVETASLYPAKKKSHNLDNVLLIYCRTVRWVKYQKLYLCQVGTIPSASLPVTMSHTVLEKKSDFWTSMKKILPCWWPPVPCPGAPYYFLHYLLQILGGSEVNSFLLPLEVSNTYICFSAQHPSVLSNKSILGFKSFLFKGCTMQTI